MKSLSSDKEQAETSSKTGWCTKSAQPVSPFSAKLEVKNTAQTADTPRPFTLQDVPIPASATTAIARDSASSIGNNSFTRLQMGEPALQIESYDLFLDVDFQNLRFDGKVKIKLKSENDVKLNSVELEILEVDANGR